MGTLRPILADRWSGGTLAALTAVLVLVQVFLSAFACAAMAGPAPFPSQGPESVICHGDGTAPTAPARDRADPRHGCPCGVLCGSGVAFAGLPPDLDIGAAYAAAGALDLGFPAAPAVPAPSRGRGPPLLPTGPPRLSA